MGRIWLIGGTQESSSLAVLLGNSYIPCTVSVTTESARALYPCYPTLRVWVGRLTAEKLDEFLHQQQIVAVVDATHPFAVEISQTAMAACKKSYIPYLRYERPTLEEQGSGGAGERGRISYLDDFEALVNGNYLEHQRVLLAVGYRPLHLFQPWQKRATLFARLLPAVTSLEAAFQAGFTPERVMCLRPPITADLELALWRHWEISLVVTKASGTAGGEDIKQAVAAQLGIPLVVIARPAVSYPQQTSDMSVVLEFCCRYVESRY